MKVMSIDEWHAAIRVQGKPMMDVTFRCPRCGLHQSARDLIDAGAGDTFEDVEGYIGFSCVGRFSKEKGCDWTLGGLFQIHELEVETPDGKRHPSFMPALAPSTVQKYIDRQAHIA